MFPKWSISLFCTVTEAANSDNRGACREFRGAQSATIETAQNTRTVLRAVVSRGAVVSLWDVLTTASIRDKEQRGGDGHSRHPQTNKRQRERD